MRRRRSADARWAASFSMMHFEGGTSTPLDTSNDDAALAKVLAGRGGRVQFRFRYEGRQRSPSIPLAHGADPVIAFRHRLGLAIAENWECGPDNTPLVPTDRADQGASAAQTATTGATAAETSQVEASQVDSLEVEIFDDAAAVETVATDDGVVVAMFPSATPEAAAAPTPGAEGVGLLGLGESRFGDLAEPPAPLATFDELVAWHCDEVTSTNAKRKSTKRLGNTLANIDSELGFAADYFRAGSLEGGLPGRSRPLGPDGICDDDCIDFGTYRKHTNLRTRSSNERCLRDWARQVERCMKADEPTPPAAVLEAEVAGKRTIQATMKTVGAAFGDAEVEERITDQPWTARVRKRIEAPARTHFTQRTLPSERDVNEIAATMRTHRTQSTVSARRATVTGERYEALVKTAYRQHTRVEELRALRLSGVVLDDEQIGPHLELREVIAMVASRYTDDGRSRQVGPLKARGLGDTRVLWLDEDEAEVLRTHIERFVPTPDPSSDDPDTRDPLVFTTHNGAMIDPSNFNSKWWRPVMEELERRLPICKDLQFRHLRHAGITRRILRGDTIAEIADDAGNTPVVIESSYRGVIEAARNSGPPDNRRTNDETTVFYDLATGALSVAEARAALATLDDDQLAGLAFAARAAHAERTDA